MLRILGDAEFGIYSLASSIISYLSFLSLGFYGGYLKFYYQYKAEDDDDGIARLNALYLTTYLIMGAVVLIAGAFLIGNIGMFFNESYSPSDIQLARKLMILLTINMALSFPASIFGSYINSQERFVFQKTLSLLTTILNPCLCIAVLFMGHGSFGMVIVTTGIRIVSELVNVLFSTKYLKMRFSFGKFDFKLLKNIAVFSFFIAINNIINEINWHTDKLILGKMIDAAAVTVYTLGSTLNTMYLSMSISISDVFAPKINSIVASKDHDSESKLNKLFVDVGRIQLYVVMLVLSGFVFFGKYFVFLWAGPGHEITYYVALMLMVPATIPLIQNIGIQIQRAKNKHKVRSFVYLGMAIINVVISILLCKKYGIIGVTVGTIISLLLANVLFMNIYYHKKLNINIIAFWKSIVSTIPGFIIPSICGVLLVKFYSFKGIMDYIVLIILYTLVYAVSVYFLSMNENERTMINNSIKKIIRR